MEKKEIILHIENFLNDKLYDMKMERIKIFTGGDLSKVYIPEPNSVDDYLNKFALYSSTAKYVELTIEPGEKISSSVKMYLMDDIEYTDTTIFMDGEPSVARIFILESNNNIRFFTSEGSYGEFGDPTEHKKEDFLKLLDNHPHLNKNKVAAHLKSIIIHNELQEDLSITPIKTKQPKI